MNWISGFENFPPYSSCCIYSPFTSKKEIDCLKKDTADMLEQDSKQYISKKISSYISPYMMNIIQRYNINPDVTYEQIQDDYLSLIYDFIKL